MVDYTADENGFHPVITYEGEATVSPEEENANDNHVGVSLDEGEKNRDKPYSVNISAETS